MCCWEWVCLFVAAMLVSSSMFLLIMHINFQVVISIQRWCICLSMHGLRGLLAFILRFMRLWVWLSVDYREGFPLVVILVYVAEVRFLIRGLIVLLWSCSESQVHHLKGLVWFFKVDIWRCTVWSGLNRLFFWSFVGVSNRTCFIIFFCL